MSSKKLIVQINKLAKKQKTVGLTTEEKELQTKLRQEYLKRFRANFENQLLNIKVIDENNNDVTPEKIIKKKKENNKNENK